MAIDPYHIPISDFNITGDVIGHGSYSQLVKAHRYADKRDYALKIANKEKAQRSRTIKYLLNERRIMLLLKHPRIIKLLWTNKDVENVYFFYEYAKNGELWELIRGFPSSIPPPALSKIWISQLVDALQYIHMDHSIQHRDLKPENIFLDDNFNLKLGDFGTSKIMSVDQLRNEFREYIKNLAAVQQRVDSQQSGNNPMTGPQLANTISPEEHRRRSIMYQATRDNSFTGTPQYMAPEIIRNASTRGLSSDLWSLGVLIYQLHSGRLPFTADTPFNCFQKVLEGDIDWSGMDPDVVDICRQLMHRDPSRRLGVVCDDGMITQLDTILDKEKRCVQQRKLAQENGTLSTRECEYDDDNNTSNSSSNNDDEKKKNNNTSNTENDDDIVQLFDSLSITHDLRPKDKPLYQSTTPTTLQGFISLRSHPYFSSFYQPNKETTGIVPSTSIYSSSDNDDTTTITDTLHTYQWNCDVPQDMIPIIQHAKDICRDYVTLLDEHGKVIQQGLDASSPVRRQIPTVKTIDDEIADMERILGDDFPLVHSTDTNTTSTTTTTNQYPSKE